MTTGLSVQVLGTGHEHELLLAGEVDCCAADDLEGWIDDLGRSKVVVDLSRVTFIDAAGLGAFVKAKHRLEQQGDQLVIVNASSRVRRVFLLADLASLLA